MNSVKSQLEVFHTDQILQDLQDQKPKTTTSNTGPIMKCELAADVIQVHLFDINSSAMKSQGVKRAKEVLTASGRPGKPKY